MMAEVGVQAKCLLCLLDTVRIALQVDILERVITSAEVTPMDSTPPAVLGVIDYHGTIIPVYSGRQRLGLPPRKLGASDRFVIFRTAERLSALCVDAVGGIEALEMDALRIEDATLDDPAGLCGLVRSADGLIVVLDMDRFLSHEEEQSLVESLSSITLGTAE